MLLVSLEKIPQGYGNLLAAFLTSAPVSNLLKLFGLLFGIGKLTQRCTLMSVLVAGTHLKQDSVWPTGHVLLMPGQDTNQVCYIGAEAPKLLLLVNAARPQAPDVYVVEAAAYQRTIQLGRLFIACQQSWPDTQLQPDVEYSVELRDGQGILNVGA